MSFSFRCHSRSVNPKVTPPGALVLLAAFLFSRDPPPANREPLCSLRFAAVPAPAAPVLFRPPRRLFMFGLGGSIVPCGGLARSPLITAPVEDADDDVAIESTRSFFGLGEKSSVNVFDLSPKFPLSSPNAPYAGGGVSSSNLSPNLSSSGIGPSRSLV